MAEPNPDMSRNAKFKLLVHEDPSNDSLMLYVDFRHVHVRLAWKDSERQDVVDLLAQGTWFLERGHLEYEVSRNSAQIDHDLQDLFPDDYEEEEE
jgi:hypothetical protein